MNIFVEAKMILQAYIPSNVWMLSLFQYSDHLSSACWAWTSYCCPLGVCLCMAGSCCSKMPCEQLAEDAVAEWGFWGVFQRECFVSILYFRLLPWMSLLFRKCSLSSGFDSCTVSFLTASSLDSFVHYKCLLGRFGLPIWFSPNRFPLNKD